MRHWPALLCLILLVRALPAAAQTEIHHCIGSNGNAVFTDQPCSALQSTPVTRTPQAGRDDAPGTPPPLLLCAANLADLRQSVIDAFARHDPNRLAGLMLWNGYGRGAAVADIGSLGVLMRQSLLDIGPDRDNASDDDPPAASGTAALAPDDAATPTAPAHQLILHVAGNDGSGSPRELRFDLVRRAGCLWLRNAD